MDKHITLLIELLKWYTTQGKITRQRPFAKWEWDNNNPENNKRLIYYGVHWYLKTDLTQMSILPN